MRGALLRLPVRLIGSGGEGSSPRMRGAPWLSIWPTPSSRIIPADAGSTGHVAQGVQRGTDHPRGCGEHILSVRYLIGYRGSSPRMRGALVVFHALVTSRGIILADAGSTRYEASEAERHRDHPRGCGEHSGEPLHLSQVVGSSPRMRGAPSRPSQDWKVRGIIPADAGSTCQQPEPGSAGGDHPRGCGEHSSQSSSFTCEVGSSPRMRGALRGYLLLNQLHRIIPADAGSTS